MAAGAETLIARTIHGVTVEAVRGDITTLEVDAIVNAANDHLWMGSGVAGAIKARGGQGIEMEAMAKGPIPIGESVETSAGDLAARYVIHAAVMGQDLRTDLPTVARTTRSVLVLAERLNVRSLALPLLGTGVGGLPVDVVGATMVDEAMVVARSGRISGMRLLFVGYDHLSSEALRDAVEGL